MINFTEIFSYLTGADKIMNEIILTTLVMSLFSTIISFALGLFFGALLGTRRNFFTLILTRINRTIMGLPPVLAGLVVFLLLSGVGPFGSLSLIYTVPAMVIAQVILITPIVCGYVESYVEEVFPKINETCIGLNLSKTKRDLLCLNQCKYQLISTLLVAFSRSIAEVGAVSIAGGNILHKTRVMTTAIVLETNMGNFSRAIAIGITLLFIALIVNILVSLFGEDRK